MRRAAFTPPSLPGPPAETGATCAGLFPGAGDASKHGFCHVPKCHPAFHNKRRNVAVPQQVRRFFNHIGNVMKLSAASIEASLELTRQIAKDNGVPIREGGCYPSW